MWAHSWSHSCYSRRCRRTDGARSGRCDEPLSPNLVVGVAVVHPAATRGCGHGHRLWCIRGHSHADQSGHRGTTSQCGGLPIEAISRRAIEHLTHAAPALQEEGNLIPLQLKFAACHLCCHLRWRGRRTGEFCFDNLREQGREGGGGGIGCARGDDAAIAVVRR